MIIKVKFSELTKSLPVVFSELTKDIPVTFEDKTELLPVKFGEIQTVAIGGAEYMGDYRITPKVKQQTVPTKDRLLRKDMTVEAIPFFNVSNTSGGDTVYIGD